MYRKFKVFHDAVNTPLTPIIETRDFEKDVEAQALAPLQGNEPTPNPP